ncbi:recQ-mediated genome instability protein 2-like [Bacillus rossius redtenbacheri]|uniref:recQ-mediated genome instability protein 2-like n=1 Tax=Bacillus rossius redtenbacheri TaxID=93214 RepID=UPI002FDCC678
MVCYHKQEEWSNKVCHDATQPAVKVFAINLQSAHEDGETWQFDLEAYRKQIHFRTVWLQGFIEEVTDVNNFMLKDSTGSLKVFSCDCVPGDKSWINDGAYCSVVGTLVRSGAVPEVATLKLADLSANPAHRALWGLEVRELQLLLACGVGLRA